jgi:FkbM family methyltransferase
MINRVARSLFPWLPTLRWAVGRGHWRELPPAADVIGWPAAARLWFAKWCQRERPDRRRAIVRLPGYSHPLHFRIGTSDVQVVEQVFVRREYAAVAALPDVSFIVDCGANIGCTTFYLLHRYPHARAAVVEPDAGNMAVCRRNLAPFKGRVTFFEAGIWSSAGPMVVERGKFGDGAEWSFQVRPASAGEKPDVNAVTLPGLMAAAGFPRIDLLKMDVEGAEAEVFGAGCDPWLRLTRNIAIETHGPACEAAVQGALTGYRREESVSGELTVFRSITPPARGAT